MPALKVEPTILTEVVSVGNWYFHNYKLGDEYFTQECAKEEYEALNRVDAVHPTLPDGAIWVNSCSATKYNTASGFIENNQFAQSGSVKFVKLAGKMASPVENDKLVDGVLDASTEAMLKETI